MIVSSKNTELTLNESENYKKILSKLCVFLKAGTHTDQENYVQKLFDLISQKKIAEFIKSINSVDMWGGAGAVWEVGFEDSNISREFEVEIIQLILLMEKSKILGNGIKPIMKIFEKNLKM